MLMLIFCNHYQLCTAAPNGTFIISAVFLTAQPDFKICLDYGNQTAYDSLG